MTAKKKSFAEDINNPALAFLSDPDEEDPVKREDLPNENKSRLEMYAAELEKAGYKLKQAGKTHRVQLVMTEELYEKARERIKGEIDPVTKRALSFNQYVSNLISADVDRAEQD